jgi:3-methyladenine DNA glycosylase AlkD
MSPSDLAADIREFCEENANPAIVEKYSRYFKEGYDAYGLSLDQVEGVAMEILEGGAGYKLIRDTSRILVRSPKYEETSFAILLTKAFEKDFTSKNLEDLEFWFLFGITNWAHTDVISGELIYPMLKRNLIGLKELESWRESERKFQRRAVPVSLIKHMKARKEVTTFLEFINPMMMDKEREVQQGLGWFLREAWKVDKVQVEEFLMNWKGKSPRLIFQYATEKMNTEEKKRFRRNEK